MALKELCGDQGCGSPPHDPWAAWPDGMAKLHGCIAPRFARREVRERVGR
jgi:hypothetical protein